MSADVFNFTFCKAFYTTNGITLTNPAFSLCSGTLKGGKDSCGGDSGGPMFLHKTKVQVGITSFGVGCGRAMVPAVNVRISGYEKWINTILCHQSAYPPAYCIPPTPAPVATSISPIPQPLKYLSVFLVNTKNSTVYKNLRAIKENRMNIYSRSVVGKDLTLIGFPTSKAVASMIKQVSFTWAPVNVTTNIEFEKPYTLSGSTGGVYNPSKYLSESIGTKTVTIKVFSSLLREPVSSIKYNIEVTE